MAGRMDSRFLDGWVVDGRFMGGWIEGRVHRFMDEWMDGIIGRE